MARRSGQNLAIQWSATLVGTYASLGCFKNWDTNQARARFDATCGGDANIVEVSGKPAFTGTAEYVFDDPNTALLAAAAGGVPIALRLFPDIVGLPNDRYEGLFNIDMSMRVAIDAAIGGTVNFSAAGDVSYLTTVIT